MNHFIEIIDNCATPKLEPNTLKLLGLIKHTALEMLELEKKQIVQAYQNGSINNYDSKKFPNLTPKYFEICANEYFEKHYKNNL